MPTNITSATAISDIASAVTFYSENLPNVDILEKNGSHYKASKLSP